MSTIKFYKDANGLLNFNGSVIPPSMLAMVVQSPTSVHLYPLNPAILNLWYEPTGKTYAISDILKENDTPYSSLLELQTAVRDFFVNAAAEAADRLDELSDRVYDVLFIDYWQVDSPASPLENEIWFNTTDSIFVRIGSAWQTIFAPLFTPISTSKIYIKRSDNSGYAWSGSAMVAISAPLTKAIIESLLTGEITSHTHYNAAPRTAALGAYAVDVSSAEIFTKTLGSNSQFTITNPILNKFFKLVITGGTLNADLFSGYTETWILNSLVTDYVPASSNILVCEIRSAGTIHLFWSE